MQKLEKQKHSHKFTNILKGIIFAIVMLAPFLAVAVRCLYVSNNENAYQSYSVSNDFQNIDNTDFEFGKTYYLRSNKTNNFFDNPITMYIDSLTNLKSSAFNTTQVNDLLNSGINKLLFANNGTTNAYIQFYTDNTLYTGVNIKNHTLSFDFTESSIIGSGDSLFYSIIFEQNNNQYSKLDNAFEYSINQLNEMPIFNWVKNTGIYTPISNMTNGLGFDNNNNPLALLLAYWSLNTAIYIVFDIIIWCFTKITHFMIDTD